MTDKPAPTPVTNPQLEDAVRELANLRTDRKAIEAREADLEKVITHELGPGRYSTISHDFTISPTVTLDTDKIAEAFPYEANRGLYTVKVNATAFRAAIPADSHHRFEKTGKTSIRIK